MKKLIFSLLVLLCSAGASAQYNPHDVLRQIRDSVDRDTMLTRYERKVIKRYLRWSRLIPSQTIMQTAGNMGQVSLGLGWDYGRREQWETHLLLGYIPKHDSSNGKLTMTLKQTFRPWQLKAYKDLYFEPLTTGLYLNTVFGTDFWGSQPSRYPDSYYDFLSTKVRINVFVGQQLTWNIPHWLQRKRKSVTLFYEVSTCDLYLRTYATEKDIKLSDILGLSVGVKMKFM